MIYVIDNYDSFTYNIVQQLREYTEAFTVIRNDAMTVAALLAHQPTGIVIGSGTGQPQAAGICCDLVRQLPTTIPLLGINLGHLIIGACYAAQIIPAQPLLHGKTATITAEDNLLFKGLSGRPFKAACYHSFVLDEVSLPETLQVIARTADNTIMAVKHRQQMVFGVQFHPESILTPIGKRLMRNFVGLCPTHNTEEAASPPF